MNSRRRWFLGWIVVAFAAAALIAPAAQAVIPANPEPAGATSQPVNKPIIPVTGTNDSFSWSDAGVGAAAAFSLVLLAGGGVLVVRGSRRSGLADA